jgi:hypothetical protein
MIPNGSVILSFAPASPAAAAQRKRFLLLSYLAAPAGKILDHR